MRTISIVATYGPSEEFGGPARIHHMGRALREAGHRVSFVVVSGAHSARKGDPNVLTIVCERPFRAPVDHIYDDVELARRAASDPTVSRRIIDHLERVGTDLIILEHPFLIETVERVSSVVGVPIIYSCANIEYRLRRDLERFDRRWERPTDRADEVRQLEVMATEIAAAVTSICPTDRAALADEFGVDSVLVPNGSTIASMPSPTGPPTRRRHGVPIDFAIAGSAYWPNVEGVARIADPSLAFLPPTTRIHVAGTMARELLRHSDIARAYSVNEARFALRGFLESGELVATFQAAQAVLVPVFTGEGSNLKTADALACGRPVIMTERASRGYEDVLDADASGVTVTSDAMAFRSTMRCALDDDHSEPVGRIRRLLLDWPSRVAPLVGLVESLARGVPGVPPAG